LAVRIACERKNMHLCSYVLERRLLEREHGTDCSDLRSKMTFTAKKNEETRLRERD
jgi:hypothetical protein